MVNRKTAAVLRVENRMLRRSYWTEAVTSVLTTGIWAGAAVLVARYFYLIVAALAGDRTVADIGIRVLADVSFSVILPVAFGIGGILYGRLQRKLRKATVERLAPRSQELEQRLDPERSSSGLTSKGDTP